MISLCTVVDNLQKDYFKLFVESILKKSRLITNVYVALISEKPNPQDYTETTKGVKFNYFNVVVPAGTHSISYKHSIGLHKCIERVNTKYVMLSDCDIFFVLSGFDEFFVNTMEINGLNIIGVEMYKKGKIKDYLPAQDSFSTIHNCLIETNKLPNPEMFKGLLRYTKKGILGNTPIDGELIEENYYLICGCILKYRHLFPHPMGHYDTGCNLFIWNELNNGKWVSFRPGFGYIPVDNYASNCKINMPKVNNSHLMYHHAGACHGNKFENFQTEYQKCCQEYYQKLKFHL